MFAGLRLGREYTNLFAKKIAMARHQQNAVFGLEHAVHHTYQHHDAHVIIEPGVDDQCFEGSIGIPLRRRNAGDDRLQNILNANPRLCTATNGVFGFDPDHILNFTNRLFRVRVGQINFVQNRNDIDALLNSRVAVGDGLCLHALAGIDHQQSALTRRE